MTVPTTSKPMTRAELVAAAGRALFGDQWQAPTADLLKLNLRTVQRLAEAMRQGRDYRVADGVLTDLKAALTARSTDCKRMTSAIERELDGPA